VASAARANGGATNGGAACLSCERHREEERALREELRRVTAEADAAAGERDGLRGRLAEYQAWEQEQDAWVEEEVAKRVADERVALLEAAREDHAALERLGDQMEEKQAHLAARSEEVEADEQACRERAGELEQGREEAAALQGALERDRVALGEAERALHAREEDLRTRGGGAARAADEVAERERGVTRDREATLREAASHRSAQAQRERAVEARVLEAEGREERASRREQALLDREREVAAAEQEAANAFHQGQVMSSAARTAAEGTRDQDVAAQRYSPDATREQLEKICGLLHESQGHNLAWAGRRRRCGRLVRSCASVRSTPELLSSLLLSSLELSDTRKSMSLKYEPASERRGASMRRRAGFASGRVRWQSGRGGSGEPRKSWLASGRCLRPPETRFTRPDAHPNMSVYLYWKTFRL